MNNTSIEVKLLKGYTGLPYIPLCVSNELSSRSVSRQVFSPLQSLTSVFGMGTGGPSALKTPTDRFRGVGNELSSRLVSKQVFSPLQSLTSVFGMGTGGPSALESPTECVGFDLFSRLVAKQVFSALQSLTSVFGMGTGGPSALNTLTFYAFVLTMRIENRTKSLIVCKNETQVFF